jgi:hypothetical protein
LFCFMSVLLHFLPLRKSLFKGLLYTKGWYMSLLQKPGYLCLIRPGPIFSVCYLYSPCFLQLKDANKITKKIKELKFYRTPHCTI